LFDDFDEEIVYNEDEENVSAGKASINTFLNGLKSKRMSNANSKKDASNTGRFGDNFPKRSGYADIDLFEFDRHKAPPLNQRGLQKLDKNDIKREDRQEQRITKESLLASLPERVRNIKTNLNKLREEEVNAAISTITQKPPSPEPESLMIVPQVIA